ncbi:hypothetical protein THAOC_22615, partial [Thalassiosira oceanica]
MLRLLPMPGVGGLVVPSRPESPRASRSSHEATKVFASGDQGDEANRRCIRRPLWLILKAGFDAPRPCAARARRHCAAALPVRPLAACGCAAAPRRAAERSLGTANPERPGIEARAPAGAAAPNPLAFNFGIEKSGLREQAKTVTLRRGTQQHLTSSGPRPYSRSAACLAVGAGLGAVVMVTAMMAVATAQEKNDKGGNMKNYYYEKEKTSIFAMEY